jgi:hypothetical protein
LTSNDDHCPANNSAYRSRTTHIHSGIQTTGEAFTLHSTVDSDRHFPVPESSGRHKGFSTHSGSGTVLWKEGGEPGSESTKNVLPIMKPGEIVSTTDVEAEIE